MCINLHHPLKMPSQLFPYIASLSCRMSSGGFPATLSAKSMARIPFSHYERSFAFVVGSTTYHCCFFIADFLSAKVARLHESDPCVDCYWVSTSDETGLFLSLLALAEGQSVLSWSRGRA
jgi:hypothetical protein